MLRRPRNRRDQSQSLSPDICDALRRRRVYKPSMSIEQVLSILHEEVAKGDLDGQAVSLLVEALDEIEAASGPLRPGWEEEQAVASVAIPAATSR